MSIPNNSEIAPDVPQMRSVLIRSAEAPSIPSHSSFHFSAKSAKPYATVQPMVTSIQSHAGSPWKPRNVPKLPEVYILERSHVSIPDADALEIAERIAECLRTQSIAATFDDNKAVAETACHTQFYVKLFEDDQQVVVEVQRRTGCSYTFHQCSKAILRAAKGLEPCNRDKPRLVVPDVIRNLEETHKVNEEVMERSFDLLQSQRVDCKELGMQNLVKLSESIPLGDRLPIIIEQVLLRPDEDDAFATMLRRDALTVLANALALSQPTQLLSNELIRTFIADLTDNDLHTAHQAARCLTSVCQSQRLKELVGNMGASPATLIAQEEGRARHELLERETRLLQMELES